MNKTYQTLGDEKELEDSIRPIVPDISLQLVFCFLSFKELPLIAQCGKLWKRVVTEPIFFKMYDKDARLSFDARELFRFSLSPFRCALRHIIFTGDFYDIILLSQLTQLVSVEIKIDLEYLEQNELQDSILASVVSFPKSVRILKLNIISIYSSSPSLHRLLIVDFSFLSSLINLDELVIGFILRTNSMSDLVVAIRTLPHLKMFDYDYYFSPDYILSFLRQLCAQPGAPSSLEYIPRLKNINISDQDECLNLLNQLPFLKIEYECTTSNYELPWALSPIVEYLLIRDRDVFSDNDINSIIAMTQLQSLHIGKSFMTEFQFQRLFNSIGNQLSFIDILLFRHFNCQVLFDCLSKCSQLENLDLGFKYSELISYSLHLHQLRSCTRLQSLEITIFSQNCNLDKQVCAQFESNLRLPSSIIPSLKHIKINTDSLYRY
jgi:hypothetical protein